MWLIPRIWEGGQCIIIGGGPSFPRQFNVPESVIQDVYAGRSTPEAYSPYMERIHNEHIIAVNMAYKLGPWVDCMFFGDDGFYHKNKTQIIDFPGLCVACGNRLQSLSQIMKVVERDRKKVHGISFEPGHVSWNGNSGAAAINLAVHFGVTRIILFGFDMKLDEGKNQHWHKYYSGNTKSIETTFKRHLTGFPKIAEDLRGKVEVINCSPDSRITAFPKIAFKDLKL